MTNQRIFPTWDQIRSIKTPLTAGEFALINYLDKYLPQTWNIFVQPFFNGDRPDVVIINQKIGVMIFEVKDWKRNIYRSNLAVGFDKSQNRKFQFRQFFVHDNRGEWKISSPIKQVDRYRSNLINQYVPNIGERIDINSKNLAPFKIGLYFHGMSTINALELTGNNPKQCTVFGRDQLDSANNLGKIVPDVKLQYSISMKTHWYNDIVFWLKPPFHSIEQGMKIVLNEEQKRHVLPSSGLHQRLRGVAGSGKTLVLAQRAANLASKGKRVLIISYNMTLWHYIKDHVSRTQMKFNWFEIEFNHFHGFCRGYLLENGYPWPHSENDSDDNFFNIRIPALVTKYIQQGINTKNRKYDAILIDEGQDFQKEWYKMLCLFLSENDELFFTIDEKQNIYEKDHNWIDSMIDTKFRGRWRILKKCYRTPVKILKLANLFSQQYLPNVGETPEAVPNQGEIFKPKYGWFNVNNFTVTKSALYRMIYWLTKKEKIHPSDIVVLVPTHKEGWEYVRYLEGYNFNINHVFEDDSTYNRHKKSFWMGDSRLKMSTIHSFKGWELLNVILITPSKGKNRDTDFLMYTSITRTRQNLVVFNTNPRYSQFGIQSQKYNDFISVYKN